jgi:hypothetical protein
MAPTACSGRSERTAARNRAPGEGVEADVSTVAILIFLESQTIVVLAFAPGDNINQPP